MHVGAMCRSHKACYRKALKVGARNVGFTFVLHDVRAVTLTIEMKARATHVKPLSLFVKHVLKPSQCNMDAQTARLSLKDYTFMAFIRTYFTNVGGVCEENPEHVINE